MKRKWISMLVSVVLVIGLGMLSAAMAATCNSTKKRIGWRARHYAQRGS